MSHPNFDLIFHKCIDIQCVDFNFFSVQTCKNINILIIELIYQFACIKLKKMK